MVDFQLVVQANLEVSAQANGAVLLGDRDDGRGPLTPIDLGEDAVVQEAIELCSDLVWKCVGPWLGLEKPRFGSICCVLTLLVENRTEPEMGSRSELLLFISERKVGYTHTRKWRHASIEYLAKEKYKGLRIAKKKYRE